MLATQQAGIRAVGVTRLSLMGTWPLLQQRTRMHTCISLCNPSSKLSSVCCVALCCAGSNGDLAVINGVLETANSIFKRYRDQYRSNELVHELATTQVSTQQLVVTNITFEKHARSITVLQSREVSTQCLEKQVLAAEYDMSLWSKTTPLLRLTPSCS
jgi:hypothetical protein